MKRRSMLIITAVLCLVALPGCGSVGRYFASRSADLMDVFTAEATVGPGVDAHLQVTSLLGTAIGSSKQYGPMMHGRYLGMAARGSGGIIVSGSTIVTEPLMWPVLGDEKYEARSRSWLAFLRWPPIVPFLKGSEWPRILDVEAGVSVLLVGVHVGVSPIEAVDFVFGLATLDMLGDDWQPEPKEEAPPATPAPEPSEKTGDAA